MYRQTFYEKFPMGIMTPTSRPDTGCPRCSKGKNCYDHGYKVIMKMLLTLYHDITDLMSYVPLEEEGNCYVRRYKWLTSALQQPPQRPEPKKLPPRPEPEKLPKRREPERLTVGALAGTRRFVGNR